MWCRRDAAHYPFAGAGAAEFAIERAGGSTSCSRSDIWCRRDAAHYPFAGGGAAESDAALLDRRELLTIVAKLRAAGAIVIAKVTMSEWARGGVDNINSVLPGFARNPYNTAYATADHRAARVRA